MSESEKLISESQYEIRYGQPKRALTLVTRGLASLTDLDPLTFRGQSGKNLFEENLFDVLSRFNPNI